MPTFHAPTGECRPEFEQSGEQSSPLFRRLNGNGVAGALGAPAIDVRGVACRFGTKEALGQVDLQVEPGEIHALLGSNGAGKTTLLRVVVGLQQPTTGTVRVLGLSPQLGSAAARHALGMVPAISGSFYQRLSGFENLLFFARLWGLSRPRAAHRAEQCLQAVGLEGASRRRVGLYSNGMRKRLAVARGLLVEPKVFVLDEATHDLDPEGVRRTLDLVKNLAVRGTAVLWATQRLDEIRGFAQRVTVLEQGQSRFVGTVGELVAMSRVQRFVVRLRNGSPDSLLPIEGVRSAVGAMGLVRESPEAEHFVLSLATNVTLGDALTALTRAGITVLSCREERSQVETALWRLAGHGADAEPAAG